MWWLVWWLACWWLTCGGGGSGDGCYVWAIRCGARYAFVWGGCLVSPADDHKIELWVRHQRATRNGSGAIGRETSEKDEADRPAHPGLELFAVWRVRRDTAAEQSAIRSSVSLLRHWPGRVRRGRR